MLALLSLLALLLPLSVSAIDYSPLVELPFVGTGAQTISGYLISLFRLLIGIAGILAVVRIVICGFQAIVSVSPSGKEHASECVLGAVTGLLLALSAWLILYQVNPALTGTEFTPPTTGSISSGTGGGTGSGGGSQQPPQCDQRNLCQEESGTVCSGEIALCAQYSGFANEFATGPVSANLLREIMAKESSCNVAERSRDGACGLMQILPTTANQHRAACGIPQSTSITCAWLQNPANARLSVCLASQELLALSRGACGTDQRQIIAGYNGGSRACLPSADCANDLGCTGRSMSRWECPYDNPQKTTCNSGPDSYEETRTYVRRLNSCL